MKNAIARPTSRIVNVKYKQPASITQTPSQTFTTPAQAKSQARIGLDGNRTYKAADLTANQLACWNPGLLSADREQKGSRSIVNARARELVASDGYANSILEQSRAAVVGDGWTLTLGFQHEALGLSREDVAPVLNQIKSGFSAWARTTDCDRQRVRTFKELLETAHDGLRVSGEFFGSIEYYPGDHTSFGTCVLMKEPECLDDRKFVRGEIIREGVHRDAAGAPLGYWVRDQHPSDYAMGGVIGRASTTSRYIPRMVAVDGGMRHAILHGYHAYRPDQTRGISSYATVIPLLKQLDRFQDAELAAALLQTSFAMVMKSDLDWSTAMNLIGAETFSGPNAQDGSAKDVFDKVLSGLWEAQMVGTEAADLHYGDTKIPLLPPGTQLDAVSTTHPNSGFAQFAEQILRRTSAGTGVGTSSMTRDYSKTNFSSARMEQATDWAMHDSKAVLLAKKFANPVLFSYVQEMYLAGLLKLPNGLRLREFWAYVVQTWLRNGKPMIDPTKELSGQKMALELGVTTRRDIAARQGKDWDQVVEELAEEEKILAALNIRPASLAEFAGVAAAHQHGDTPPPPPKQD